MFIQIPHDVVTEMCGVLYHAGSTPANVFTEKYSLRRLAIHFAKIWYKCWLSDVAQDVQSK
jgi:hypothetical protein